MWPTELIPDDDSLLMRVHKNWVKNGEVLPGFFTDHDGGMSADWEHYSSPEETRNRARAPQDNVVIGLVVGHVRAIQGLTVVHEPLQENRAHSEVFGEKTVEHRVKLSRIYSWKLP